MNSSFILTLFIQATSLKKDCLKHFEISPLNFKLTEHFSLLNPVVTIYKQPQPLTFDDLSISISLHTESLVKDIFEQRGLTKSRPLTVSFGLFSF